jgi:hypothetical protein
MTARKSKSAAYKIGYGKPPSMRNSARASPAIQADGRAVRRRSA